MIKQKLTAGSRYIKHHEAQAIEHLRHILSTENGYIIPIMFIGKQIVNREIDALLLLPDRIFLLDFKNWAGDRIEVEGANGRVRRLRSGAWKDEHNSLPNYDYAARELASRLNHERWLPWRPYINSIMVFTHIGFADAPQVSFAGGDPQHPQPEDGMCACLLEQLPQVIEAFREADDVKRQLDQRQLSTLAEILIKKVKASAKPSQRRVGSYMLAAKHHDDTFLDCKIYLGEGEPLGEPVWVKEYEQVLAALDHRDQKERLVLRHADILHRFPQHKNIVAYRNVERTDSHLYIILKREPGAFLSELYSGNPLGQGKGIQAELQNLPFGLDARLRILGGLLHALEYLTQQLGLEQSAYRDLRPDNIFVQYDGSEPIAQLFNFDCTKLPGSFTRFSHLKRGQQRFPVWDDYASPELLEYIAADQSRLTGVTGFTGGVRSDLFSWGIIAWELLTGQLPFPDNDAKLAGRLQPWPTDLDPRMQVTNDALSPATVELIQASLELLPVRRPDLATLKRAFP